MVGIGFSLLVFGFYLLLVALSAIAGKFVLFGIADGTTLALFGSVSILIGIALLKLQNKLAPEGEADGGQQAGA